MSDPWPGAEANDVVSHQPQPDLPAPPAKQGGVPEAVAEGERLGIPEGATRHIADPGRPQPSYVFLALVSISTLAADVATKAWAERNLGRYPGMREVWKDHLTLVLAKNRGGAWGLLQSTSESVRRPFFLLVSLAAIVFIMSLYRRLQPRQDALRWGLPLVLGGALGNVLDRIRAGQVIDFIDAHVMYRGIDRHWPTFNVADIAICVGVGLMAIDMFGRKRGPSSLPRGPRIPPAQSGEAAVDWHGVAVSPPSMPTMPAGASAHPAHPAHPAEEPPAAAPRAPSEVDR